MPYILAHLYFDSCCLLLGILFISDSTCSKSILPSKPRPKPYHTHETFWVFLQLAMTTFSKLQGHFNLHMAYSTHHFLSFNWLFVFMFFFPLCTVNRTWIICIFFLLTQWYLVFCLRNRIYPLNIYWMNEWTNIQSPFLAKPKELFCHSPYHFILKKDYDYLLKRNEEWVEMFWM